MVIRLYRFPSGFGVAALAIGPQTAQMLIIFLMATDTSSRGVAIFHPRLVARRTGRGRVFPFQGIVGQTMLERRFSEFDERIIAAAMLAVAGFALAAACGGFAVGNPYAPQCRR